MDLFHQQTKFWERVGDSVHLVLANLVGPTVVYQNLHARSHTNNLDIIQLNVVPPPPFFKTASHIWLYVKYQVSEEEHG